MQYHLNGFKPGNLQISESVREQTTPDPIVDLPEAVDVLIVGCGPAGLTLNSLTLKPVSSIRSPAQCCSGKRMASPVALITATFERIDAAQSIKAETLKARFVIAFFEGFMIP